MVTPCDSLLGRLRRSLLGAWLAVGYALAVLAMALAPMQGAQAFGLESGAVLCSGNPVPSENGPATPLGELAHCKGCAHHPLLAAAPPAAAAMYAPGSRLFALVPVASGSLPQGAVRGLPPSRAPPVA